MNHIFRFLWNKNCPLATKNYFGTLSYLCKRSYFFGWHASKLAVCHKDTRCISYGIYSNQCCAKFSKRTFSQSVLDSDSALKFILENTELSTDHLTPEIALHLITPRCRLWWSRGEDCEVEDPFWAFYWPGGQALTRYLLDHGDVTFGKRVLDVGSGCGASAIAAHMSGAAHVTANDICPVAACAIQLNADASGVTVDVVTDNLIGQPSSCWDVILLGDMFYDCHFAAIVTRWIEGLHRDNCTVLIGDPGRAAFRDNRIHNSLKLVYQAELPPTSKEENFGLTHGFVWQVSMEDNVLSVTKK